MQPGSRIAHFEVLGLIGAGGMGEVYRARDPRLGRDVAIKVLPPEVASDRERLRRFEQEARAVAALDHPNILSIHDVGTHRGAPYLVTELLEGESLRERIQTGLLPPRKAVELAVQIARGLAAAHSKGIVHRDLKPGNVFITKDGQVKILDFGIAKLAESRTVEELAVATTVSEVTHTGAVLGTAGYMSPEQVRGQSVDPRSDIFSFGCVLYEMLSGLRAFQGDTRADTLSAILSKDPPALSSTVGELPPALDRIVQRCLEKHPEERFSSAHDLALALDAVTTEPGPARRTRHWAGLGVAERLVRTAARVGSGLFAAVFPSSARRLQRLLVAIGVVAALAVLISVVVHQRRVAWARSTAVTELMRLADTQQFWPAFLLAKRMEAIVPNDPTLVKLWPEVAGKFERPVVPASSRVFVRSKGGAPEHWVEIGEATGTPLHAPLGLSVYRVEHAGFEPAEFSMTVRDLPWGSDEHGHWAPVVLARRGELPDGMVRVERPPEKSFLGLMPDLYDFTQEGLLGSFLVDAHEVTNREYKRFVDAGGYQRREYWREPFKRDGKTLSWDEALALFRDATGRPGPSGWEVGTYPSGKDQYPVTGVSWYEAAAYAAFAGKRLPSVYHWAVASRMWDTGDLVRGSNFSGALAPVGSFRGSLNFWGLVDIAGNAAEWCFNASGDDRFVMGGGCDGPSYMFWNANPKSPFERNPTVGFRCIKQLAAEPHEAELDRPVGKTALIDWGKEKPLSEDAWRTWTGLLSYAKAPLGARVEWTDDTLPSWKMEKVSFAAAYGNERVVAYLFLPRSVPPPWQVVIFWPGAYAAMVSTSEDGRNTTDASYWSYLVRDGRAVLYPILKGTFERGGRIENVSFDVSMDSCIPVAKDIFRSLDYLETRPDVQKDRIGFLGFSWGGIAGPFVCAVDKRIKVEVLWGGGVYDRDLMGFVRHCSTPTQMVNGRLDGYAEAQAPMFRALATPPDQKRHIVFDSDHTLAGFEKEVVKANLEWFDRFLGPVR